MGDGGLRTMAIEAVSEASIISMNFEEMRSFLGFAATTEQVLVIGLR